MGTELAIVVAHDEKEVIRRDLEREIEDARRLRVAIESTRSPITTPLPVNSTDRMLSEKSVARRLKKRTKILITTLLPPPCPERIYRPDAKYCTQVPALLISTGGKGTYRSVR